MNELTCRAAVDLLMDYQPGLLDPDQRAAFEAHLAECDACVAYLRQYEETVRLGKAAFERRDVPAGDPVPADLVEAILAARRKHP